MIRPIEIAREIYTYRGIKKIRQVAIDKFTGEHLGDCIAEYVPEENQYYSTKHFLSSYVAKREPRRVLAKPHMYIEAIEVYNPEMRKQGIAKSLVSGVVKESQDLGYKGRVVLQAENFRESPLPAYIKMGFTTAQKALDEQVKRFLEFPIGKFDPTISSFMMLKEEGVKILLELAKKIKFL